MLSEFDKLVLAASTRHMANTVRTEGVAASGMAESAAVCPPWQCYVRNLEWRTTQHELKAEARKVGVKDQQIVDVRMCRAGQFYHGKLCSAFLSCKTGSQAEALCNAWHGQVIPTLSCGSTTLNCKVVPPTSVGQPILFAQQRANQTVAPVPAATTTSKEQTLEAPQSAPKMTSTQGTATPQQPPPPPVLRPTSAAVFNLPTPPAAPRPVRPLLPAPPRAPPPPLLLQRRSKWPPAVMTRNPPPRQLYQGQHPGEEPLVEGCTRLPPKQRPKEAEPEPISQQNQAQQSTSAHQAGKKDETKEDGKNEEKKERTDDEQPQEGEDEKTKEAAAGGDAASKDQKKERTEDAERTTTSPSPEAKMRLASHGMDLDLVEDREEGKQQEIKKEPEPAKDDAYGELPETVKLELDDDSPRKGGPRSTGLAPAVGDESDESEVPVPPKIAMPPPSTSATPWQRREEKKRRKTEEDTKAEETSPAEDAEEDDQTEDKGREDCAVDDEQSEKIERNEKKERRRKVLSKEPTRRTRRSHDSSTKRPHEKRYKEKDRLDKHKKHTKHRDFSYKKDSCCVGWLLNGVFDVNCCCQCSMFWGRVSRDGKIYFKWETTSQQTTSLQTSQRTSQQTTSQQTSQQTTSQQTSQQTTSQQTSQQSSLNISQPAARRKARNTKDPGAEAEGRRGEEKAQESISQRRGAQPKSTIVARRVPSWGGGRRQHLHLFQECLGRRVHHGEAAGHLHGANSGEDKQVVKKEGLVVALPQGWKHKCVENENLQLTIPLMQTSRTTRSLLHSCG